MVSARHPGFAGMTGACDAGTCDNAPPSCDDPLPKSIAAVSPVTSDKDQERSPSGATIHRLETPKRSGDREAIEAHVEKHLGKIENVFREVVADGTATEPVHIDVLHVPPNETRPLHTLVTTGMSDRAMAVPNGTNSPRYLELMMSLPRSWRFDKESQDDPRWSWPVRQLKVLARMPHINKTWLGWGHTVPNDEPPTPLAPNTKLCGAIIVPSLLVPEAFFELKIAAHTITFFSVVPLYKEEMQLKVAQGADALFGKLIDAGIKDLVDPGRRNVAKKRFGLF
jgi:hypothetical protein